MTAKWCPNASSHDAGPCVVCDSCPPPIIPAPDDQVEPEFLEALTAALGWCAPSPVDMEGWV